MGKKDFRGLPVFNLAIAPLYKKIQKYAHLSYFIEVDRRANSDFISVLSEARRPYLLDRIDFLRLLSFFAHL